MEKIRIGIVGSGGMAKRHAETFGQMAECRLMAVASRNSDTGPSLAAQHGMEFLPDWRTLLDRKDVDAVVICTHNDSHSQIAIPALEAEKHVFTEYPATRSLSDAARLEGLIQTSRCVLRVAHNENVSGSHRTLKAQARSMGDLLTALFSRLTPRRGGRPEVLFNLTTSGPPALFFVYHVYPLVDLFGPAAWVESGAEYGGLTDAGRYDRFVNAVTVGFKRGGLGQWNWAGGIEIQSAEEYQRIVLSDGTLIKEGGKWCCSTASGAKELPVESNEQTLQAQFLEEMTTGATGWRRDAKQAVDAARIGLAAELSAAENQRVILSEIV